MKKYNLTDLLGGSIEIEIDGQSKNIEINGVKIPIIQRDYAQGRVEESIVRNRFLEALFGALVTNQELELDFVYGSIEKLTDSNKGNQNLFLPLDGQQRLTTLFLLYWYVMNIELTLDDQKPIREQLARFSYSTRSTARDFCEELTTRVSETQDIKNHIENAYWFNSNFKQDPTVIAMLNTLDHIENKYSKLNLSIYKNLTNLCFYILPLEDFNLTDELYIKMNARGKQLTDFENFKADFINYMKDGNHSNELEFHKEVVYRNRTIPFYLNVASKLDNEWTDVFWPLAKLNTKDEDKVIDNYFLRFINRYLLNYYITNSGLDASKIETSDSFKFLYGSNDGDTLIKYRQFNDYQNLISFDSIRSFEKIMDKIIKYHLEIKEAIKPSWISSDNWFLFDEKINQRQRILLLGITEYLELNDFFDQVKFKEWIRVVWNIIIDPNINDVKSMIIAMRVVKNIAKGSNDIQLYLESNEFDAIIHETNNFHREQLIEERQKAILIKISGWKEKIISAESNYLFLGNIGFLISDNPELNLFELKFKNAEDLFNKSSIYRLEFKLLRYLVSKFSGINEVLRFNYQDSDENWQRNLRRNKTCQNIINYLCSLENLDAINNEIELSISQPSKLEGTNKAELLHWNLYSDQEFIKWLQKKQVYEIKLFENYIYIGRSYYRGDWVMINSYRNNLIERLCKILNTEIENRCNDSNLFHGIDIEVKTRINNQNFIVLLDRYNQIIIKFYEEEDSFINLKIHKTIDASDINSDIEALEFAELIYKELELIS